MSGRCVACNNIMSSQEMTRRNRVTDQFVDLCSSCLVDTGIVYYDNPANREGIIIEEELFEADNDTATDSY